MDKRHSYLRLIVAAFCAVVALLACSSPQVTHLSTAPAEQLSLRLSFTNLLTPAAEVIVDVVVSSDPNTRVALADNQRLTVNGRAPDSPPLIRLGASYRFTVPRSSTGGEYTFVYTDERGQQTSVVVPTPQHDLTITSPAAHAQVPIPTPGAPLALRYTAPELFPATARPPNSPYTRIEAGAEGHCQAARPDGISASAPSCINFGSTQSDESGAAVISDTGALPEYGFINLAPGAGELYVRVDVYGYLPPAGFVSVLLSVTDIASIPITWVSVDSH
ncbi:MAG TPA: hypothetical protein VH393_10975 [Ktedonobacterales bacterium]